MRWPPGRASGIRPSCGAIAGDSCGITKHPATGRRRGMCCAVPSGGIRCRLSPCSVGMVVCFGCRAGRRRGLFRRGALRRFLPRSWSRSASSGGTPSVFRWLGRCIRRRFAGVGRLCGMTSTRPCCRSRCRSGRRFAVAVGVVPAEVLFHLVTLLVADCDDGVVLHVSPFAPGGLTAASGWVRLGRVGLGWTTFPAAG